MRIVDTATSPAEGNTIGGSRTSTVGTADCGGDCNVIAATNLGIDLHGETSKSLGSATGPTTISGNYIGLAADGTELPQNAGSFGIYANRPSNAAPTDPGRGHRRSAARPRSKGTVIDNGPLGMVAEGAEEPWSRATNLARLPASETSGSEPGGAGLAVADEGVSELPELVENTIYLRPPAVGVESFGPGAVILGNSIYGGKTGVFTADDDAGVGNLIAENLIVDSIFYGVLIENNVNMVTGNGIFGAGRNGVATDHEVGNPWPTGNKIGGDSPFLENLIEESEESAISVGGEPETTNEVLGNFGFENGGPFIELREHSAGHPTNEEIKPPTVEVVYESSVSGTAKPGAKVRLFGKPSSGSRFAGTDDRLGDRRRERPLAATFAAKIAVGQLVAATQTTAAGTPQGATSEVSAPVAAAADPIVPVTPATGTGTGAAVPAPVAPKPVTPKAPSVKITKGPKKSSSATSAKFFFKASPAAGAKFECKLDGSKWAKCTSPKTYKKLKVGKHTFRVRAIASGLTGAVVKYQFTVKAYAPAAPDEGT